MKYYIKTIAPKDISRLVLRLLYFFIFAKKKCSDLMLFSQHANLKVNFTH